MTDSRLANEIAHGKAILEKGEEAWNWSSPTGRMRFLRRCQFFKDALGNTGKQVLEIGCGTGLFTQELAQTNNQILSIDISAELIQAAKARTLSGNVRFVVADACRTGLPPSSFDFVVGSSCLHHLEVNAALKEFHRVLKPGGKIIFTEPNMLNPQIALQKNVPFLKKWALDSPDETAFFKNAIRKKITTCGFTDVRAVPFDFLHPFIPGPVAGFLEKPFIFLEKVPLLREIAGSLLITAAKP